MAQSQERRADMEKIKRAISGRGQLFALFLLFTRFADDETTSSGLGMKTFSPSRRFSAQLRWASGCAQLAQKGGHGPSDLRQREHRAPVFPRSIAALKQRTSQDQQIVCTGDHPCPAFGTLRGTQPWHIPEQFLLVEAVAMLVRMPQLVDPADLSQRCRAVPLPDNPADLRVTRPACRAMTNDLEDRDFHEAGGAQVQVLPTADLDLCLFGINPSQVSSA
jgi:hypothetical protein